MIKRDGWWIVAHDHESRWYPKEEWIKSMCAPGEWICWRAEFGPDNRGNLYAVLLKPMEWGFKNKDIALLFVLAWSNNAVE